MTKADYEGFAKRVCELWHYAPGSPEYKTAYAENVAVWDYVQEVADANKDGRVSLDEFLASYDVTINDARHFDRMVTGYGTTMVKLADLDRDGKISGEEYVALLGCYGIEKKAAQEAFRRLDLDKTGDLSTTEIVERYKEFLGDDPDAPGNWSVGPY